MQNVGGSAVREFRNLCRNHENLGLMMWEKAKDTWHRTMVNKIDYKEVTVCRNDL